MNLEEQSQKILCNHLSILNKKFDNENELFYKKMIYQNLIKIQKARANYTLNRYLENENPLFSNSYNRFVCFCRNIRKSELQQLIDYFK